MRVVIDTNQLFRMAAAGASFPLWQAWQQQTFHLVMSEELLTELTSVMARPSVARFLRHGRSQQLLNLLHERAIFVVPVSDAPTCRDPNDQMVIATALAGHAAFIVTADRDLIDDPALHLALTPYNLQVVYPAKFLELLKRDD